MYYNSTLRLGVDRTVQGGDLGLGESWRTVRQVSVYATAVESVELYLSYGKEGCARVNNKIVLFFGEGQHHERNTGYQ